MSNLTKQELEQITVLSDKLSAKIEEFVKRGAISLNPVKKEVMKFADKNADVLQTNIVGKQLLMNEQVQDNILSAMGLESKEVKAMIKESEYFMSFGDLQLTEQLAFAIPLLLASGAFYRQKKYAESEFFYNLAFYKPYAARVSRYYPHGVNDDQMMYTVENSLTERFDIKKLGTLQAVIQKMAKSSYDNYIDTLKDADITDKSLHLIFTAGIYSRLNIFLQTITDKYHKNKGKYLPFQQGTFEGSDDSEGETFERDIKSDTSVKVAAVRKAVNNVMKNPVDDKLADIAAKFGFIGMKETYGTYKYSGSYTELLKNLIQTVVENKYKELPIFFESIIGSFLYSINDNTQKKFTANDLRSPIFLTSALKVFKSPHTNDENMLRVQKMLREMLNEHSIEYINFGNTQKRKLEKALFFYFVLLIQKG
jgi:hypothetical protein